MDITLEELRPVIDAWRWTEDPSGRLALLALASVLLLASVMLYLPLTIKWMQLAQLDRKLADLAKRASGSIPGRMALWNQAFRKSPAEFQWKELQKVWLFQRNQAGPEALQEPASLAAILDRWPLLPRGLRRRVLESVPGLLMLIGVMGAVLSISVALSTRTSSDGAPALSNLGAAVLSAPLWGLGLALITTIASRLFHGAFEHYSESMDRKTSLAFEPFCDENPRETGTTKAEPLPALEPEIREVPEIESTHIAHLQLNKVTRQMSALIDHLHESGFALRNAASALRSTQGRIENNSEEIRISLKQAASTVVDQGGFIQMSLDQIRTALEKPEVPSPSLHVAERSVTPKDVTLEKQREVAAESLPSTSGRWLGPDPYARLEANERRDTKTVQRLLGRHESESNTQPIESPAPAPRSEPGPGKLSDLLAQTSEKTVVAKIKAVKSSTQGERREAGGVKASPVHSDKAAPAAAQPK